MKNPVSLNAFRRKLWVTEPLSGTKFALRRARLFRAARGQLLASARLATGRPHSKAVFIARKNEQTGKFELLATAVLLKNPKGIEIVGASSVTREKTGLNVFRIFVEHAKAVAKGSGLNKILLDAQSDRLKRHYEGMGFQFKNRRDPFEGVLSLNRGNRKQIKTLLTH